MPAPEISLLRRAVRRVVAHRTEAATVGGFMVGVALLSLCTGAVRVVASTAESSIACAVLAAFATVWAPLAIIDFRRCTRETALRAQVEQDLERHTRVARAQACETARVVGEAEAVLARGGPTIVCQPIVDMQNGRVVGFEALSRFSDGRAPDVWFADAARVGLGVDLELAAIENALRCLDVLPKTAYLSVNAGPETLLDPRLVPLIAAYQPRRTVVEVTEHLHFDDYEGLRRVIMKLRDVGARVAVDDTGSGYASFRHIVDLRPDVIKVDRSLVRGVDRDPARRSLMIALVAFAHDVNATLVAEGVECVDEASALRTWGVRFAQGWLYGKPAPPGIAARRELSLLASSVVVL